MRKVDSKKVRKQQPSKPKFEEPVVEEPKVENKVEKPVVEEPQINRGALLDFMNRLTMGYVVGAPRQYRFPAQVIHDNLALILGLKGSYEERIKEARQMMLDYQNKLNEN